MEKFVPINKRSLVLLFVPKNEGGEDLLAVQTLQALLRKGVLAGGKQLDSSGAKGLHVEAYHYMVKVDPESPVPMPAESLNALFLMLDDPPPAPGSPSHPPRAQFNAERSPSAPVSPSRRRL